MKITGERRCIACRMHDLKQNLLRVSNGANGIVLDDRKKINGRGIYICKKKECIELVCKKKLLNKAFSKNIDSQIYDNLRGYIEEI